MKRGRDGRFAPRPDQAELRLALCPKLELPDYREKFKAPDEQAWQVLWPEELRH